MRALACRARLHTGTLLRVDVVRVRECAMRLSSGGHVNSSVVVVASCARGAQQKRVASCCRLARRLLSV